MSRFMNIFAVLVLAFGLGACSSHSGERTTASDGDDVKVYRPTVGEPRLAR